MKKFILVLGVFAAVALTSCSKEKDCECVATAAGITGGTTEVTIDDGDCSDMDENTTTMGIETTLKCTEK